MLGSQAEPGGTRWFALGALFGLLVSGLLVSDWHRDARGLSVTVLGAGRQASVLITSHHRRVLIAGGTNGASFSNALANALPPIDKEFDVILIDPAASLDVRDRARSLKARVIWTLPDSREPAVADTVGRSFSIQFDDETSLRLIVSDEGAWHAVLTSTAGLVFIAPDVGRVPTQPGYSAAVVTHVQENAAFNVPLLVALPGMSTAPDQQLRVARPGSNVRLELGDGEVRARVV